MITYFPTPYPDESFYSLFARYAVGEGLNDSTIYRKIYGDRKTSINLFYLNKIDPDIKTILAKNMPWNEVIKAHTIFNYMSGFLEKDQKQKALTYLENDDLQYKRILPPMTKYKNRIMYMKYCPICVKKDREKYGESYWHVEWLIPEINTCPIHRCYLCNSKLQISSIKKILLPAESNIQDVSKVKVSDDISYKIATYIYELLHQKSSLKIPIGNIIKQYLHKTKYASFNGKNLYPSMLSNDMNLYYYEYDTISKDQISYICQNTRKYPYDIIRLLIYLDIPLNEVYSISREQNIYENFLKEIVLLRKQGMRRVDIANKLNTTQGTIKYAEKRYIHDNIIKIEPIQHKCHPRIVKQNEKIWHDKDMEYKRKIKTAINQENFWAGKTEHITCTYFFRRLEKYNIFLDKNKLRKMPECDKIIRSYCETYEHYWARKICIFANEMMEQNIPLSMYKIAQTNGICKKNVIRSMEEIKKFDEKVWKELSDLLKA